MQEDQIEPLRQRLFEAIRKDEDENAQAIALELLAGFLIDINRLAWFAECIASHYEANR